jgi:hypothetical protein
MQSLQKFNQWMSTLDNQLHKNSRQSLESTTNRLIQWEERLAKDQAIDARLRNKERQLLKVAGQRMLREYSRKLNHERRVHKLDTIARHEAVARFIYYFGRYLVPVLNRCPRKYSKSAVEYAINNAVMEHLSSVEDPQDLQAEYALAILKSARSLGLGVPTEMSLKCKAALQQNFTLEDFLRSFAVPWDKELVKASQRIFKNRRFSDKTLYDALMMTISKLPEHRLANYLANSNMDKGEPYKGAADLLSVALRNGWIPKEGNEPSPLFYLLKWYFSALRNVPHHEFTAYTLENVRDSLLITNFVLNKLDAHASIQETERRDVRRQITYAIQIVDDKLDALRERLVPLQRGIPDKKGMTIGDINKQLDELNSQIASLAEDRRRLVEEYKTYRSHQQRCHRFNATTG